MVVFAPLFGFDYTLERHVVRYGHGFERIFLEIRVHPCTELFYLGRSITAAHFL
jgi:hypothetical protein